MSPRPARSQPAARERPPDPDASAAPWRLFVAVPLPADVRELVASLTAELAGQGWPVRWVAAENAHLTLHFLGDTVPEQAELVRLALPAVVGRHPAFDLRTTGLGVFPNQRRPRVLWLGLHGPAHRLETLQRDIGATLRGLDFAVEEGPFSPHITLGRVRNAGTATFPLRDLPAALRRLLAEAGIGGPQAPPARPFPVREVELIRSHLGGGRPRYEVVGRYPLTAGGRG